MTIYDISHPYDLRVRLNKPAMTTEEIDALLTNPGIHADLKQQLQADVEPQGYRPAEPSEYVPSGYVRAVLELLLAEGVLTKAQIEEAIGVDQVDIVTVLEETEEHGLIERVTESPATPRWQITDDGRKVIGKYAR